MESYQPGDKVKITGFYLDNYPSWGPTVKDKEATVISVRALKVLEKNLLKDERPVYHSAFGMQTEYTLYEIMINLDGHNYLVSQLGFSK